MSSSATTPVIIGVGEVLQRVDDPTVAEHAIGLMAAAARAAAVDADATRALDTLDAVAVVSTLTWRYGDPARLVAADLGIAPDRLIVTTPGGNSPQSLVNEASRRIVAGELNSILCVGGEAFRTRMRARRGDVTLDWPKVPAETLAAEPPETWGKDLTMNSPHETELGLIMPVQVYPMFETAIRAARGVSPAEHLADIAQLWSRFSAVAATNPNAWIRTAMNPGDIITPSDRNRMVGAPYTKVMNSNNDVDMAAAVIVCSAQHAESLGVPRDRWVFPHAGTDCHEHAFISDRDEFFRTPAVEIGSARAMELAGVGIDDIDHIDLYSCFPSAVQLGAKSLGLNPYSDERQLTQTGGLAFAGGPWNNYVMHAIAAMVRRLRDDAGSRGLVWANGGYATKHAFGVYSTEPPATPFRHDAPQEVIDALPRRSAVAPADLDDPSGRIEAYTVMHERDGSPGTAWAAVRVADGRRMWARDDRPDVAAALLDGEWVGRRVVLDATHRITDT